MHEVRSGNFLWRGSESCVPQQTSVNGLESHGGHDGLIQPHLESQRMAGHPCPSVLQKICSWKGMQKGEASISK